jgi:hypothetical protein
MLKIIAGTALVLGFTAFPAIADNSSNIQPSTQSSHPGVKGDVGGKNGPSAKPSTGATDNSNSGSSAGSSVAVRTNAHLALI